MAEITVSGAAIGALADRLDAMSDQFSQEEREAIHALFFLAGSALSDQADVEGFALRGPFDADSGLTLRYEPEISAEGSRAGLRQGLDQGSTHGITIISGHGQTH